MNIHPRKLFLIDGLGALLSSFLLGIVLVKLEPVFGMPKNVLAILSLLALLFAVYSLVVYWIFPERWRPAMRVIAVVNLLYCCVTLGLVYAYREVVTDWGVLYFVLEVVVVASLATLEWRTASRARF
ncbi:MAG: hypothetical protein IT270_03125 [Saprospiraceae bacterium]|nr:hypothetical protein [Saprospiraceae bacterium]